MPDTISTDTALEEMRRLLRRMNELENHVLSLQDTIAEFRHDVRQRFTDACDRSTPGGGHGAGFVPRAQLARVTPTSGQRRSQ